MLFRSYGSTKCTVSIPVPAGGFLGGHSYEYEMIFNADSLTTALVRVLPWKEVEVSDDVDGFGEKKDSTHVSK